MFYFCLFFVVFKKNYYVVRRTILVDIKLVEKEMFFFNLFEICLSDEKGKKKNMIAFFLGRLQSFVWGYVDYVVFFLLCVFVI